MFVISSCNCYHTIIIDKTCRLAVCQFELKQKKYITMNLFLIKHEKTMFVII